MNVRKIRPGAFKATLFTLFFSGVLCTTLASAAAQIGQFELSIHEHKVTLFADGAPVRDILDALAKEEQFELVAYGEISTLSSTSFVNQPLRKAIEILAGDYSLMFQDKQNAPGQIERVWVFGKTDSAIENEIENAIDNEMESETDITITAIDSLPLNETSIAHNGSPVATRDNILTTDLQNQDAEIRIAALQQLTAYPSARTIKQLETTLTDDPSERVRLEALYTLQSIGGPDAYQATLLSLRDKTAVVRTEGLQTLNRLDPDAALPQVANLYYGDPDPAVQKAAQNILESSSHPAAAAILKSAPAK